MDLYIANRDFYNVDDKRVKFSKGDVIEFKDAEKLKKALDANFVTKVNYKVFEEKKETKTTKTTTTKSKAKEEVKEDIKADKDTVK